MLADNDNAPPRDYFMPKLSRWRYVWLGLFALVVLVFARAVILMAL